MGLNMFKEITSFKILGTKAENKVLFYSSKSIYSKDVKKMQKSNLKF